MDTLDKYSRLLERFASLQSEYDYINAKFPRTEHKYLLKIENLHKTCHQLHVSNKSLQHDLEESTSIQTRLTRRVDDLQDENSRLRFKLQVCQRDLQMEIELIKDDCRQEEEGRYEELRRLYVQERDLNTNRREGELQLRDVLQEKNKEIRELRDQLIRIRDLIKSKK
jgi:hypothetical protein